MAEDDERFLSRWSDRKRRDKAETAPPAAEEKATPAESPAAPPDESPEEAQRRLGLPDIESLEDSSDFAQFMAEGVPEVLRRRALRRLWRLNPVYANLDGLAEYDEDFRDAGLLADGVKTLYKVGKGMFDKQEEAAAARSAPVDEAAALGDEAVEEMPDAAARPVDEADEDAAAEDAVLEARPPEAEPPADESPCDGAPAPVAQPGPPRGSAARRRWGDSIG